MEFNNEFFKPRERPASKKSNEEVKAEALKDPGIQQIIKRLCKRSFGDENHLPETHEEAHTFVHVATMTVPLRDGMLLAVLAVRQLVELVGIFDLIGRSCLTDEVLGSLMERKEYEQQG